MNEKQIRNKQILLATIALGISITVFIPVIYLLNEFLPTVADPIILPDINEIETIEITATDDRIVSYNDTDWIEQFLSILAQATPTSKESIQDRPNTDRYGKVDIYNNGGITTIFYYAEDGKYYIEQPYQGVYATDVDIDAFTLYED